MEPLALLLRLHLGVPKAGLHAHPVPIRGSQLQSQLLVPALGDGEGLACLHAEVIRKPRLVAGIFHPLFGGENLLDGLHKDNQKNLGEISKQKTGMRVVGPS